MEPILLSRSGPPFSIGSRYHEGTLLTGLDDRDPQPVLLLHRVERLRLGAQLDHQQGARSRRHLPRLPARPAARRRPLPAHALHRARGDPARTATRSPTRRSSTRCTSSCRSATATARWCGRPTKSSCCERLAATLSRMLPEIPPQYVLHAQALRPVADVELVDLFLAPSELLARPVRATGGFRAEKIRVEEYGRRAARPTLRRPSPQEAQPLRLLRPVQPTSRGPTCARSVAKRLAERRRRRRGSGSHGANLEMQPEEFQDEFAELLEASGDSVELVGRYDHYRARRS